MSLNQGVRKVDLFGNIGDTEGHAINHHGPISLQDLRLNLFLNLTLFPKILTSGVIPCAFLELDTKQASRL